MTIWHGNVIYPAAIVIRAFPSLLRPAVGRLVRFLVGKRFTKPSKELIMPHIATYLKEADDLVDGRSSLPSDNFLSWYIIEAKKSSDTTYSLDPTVIYGTLCTINFAGLVPVKLMATSVVIDLLAAQDSSDLIDALRAEITEVSKTIPGRHFTWKDLERLPLVDAAIRESCRLSLAGTVDMQRLVSQRIVTPDNVTLEPGSVTAMPVHAIHGDESIYPDPAKYNPFRYLTATSPGAASNSTETTSTKKSSVTELSYKPTAKYVTFGYGTFVRTRAMC